ncbi:hypothetical protein D3C78_1704590 [compost metagenome]
MCDEQPHFGLLRQPGKGDVWRILFLHLNHAQVRATDLQQVNHVTFFSDHPLQFDILITLLELLHQPVMVFRLIGIGKHYA